MIRSRQFLPLGLLALMLGVMAFGAASAQAAKEEVPEWMVNGANINLKVNTDLLPEVQVTEVEKLPGKTERHLVLLSESGTTPIEILCETAAFVGIKLISHGLTTEGDVHFTGCKFFLKGVENANCKPHSKGKAEGEILIEPSDAKIVLHKLESNGVNDTVVLILPTNAEMLFVKMILGAEGAKNLCPIGESVKITGEFLFEDCLGDPETELETHLLQEYKGLSGKTVKFGIKPMSIDGSIIVTLAGAHKGLTFSALAD